MKYLYLIISIILLVYAFYDLGKTLILKKRRPKEKRKLFFLAPYSVYMIISLLFLLSLVSIILFLSNQRYSFLLFASVFLCCGCLEFTKCFIIVLKDGWYLHGVYFTTEEIKNCGQFYIMPHANFRTIYKVTTEGKSSYIYISKKNEDKLNQKIRSVIK